MLGLNLIHVSKRGPGDSVEYNFMMKIFLVKKCESSQPLQAKVMAFSYSMVNNVMWWYKIYTIQHINIILQLLVSLLLTWFNINPSMDK